MSDLMKDAFEKQLDNEKQTKSVAHTYAEKRDCSIQECVYHLLSGHWLRKTFLDVFSPIAIFQKKRYRICLSKERISELLEVSTDVF